MAEKPLESALRRMGSRAVAMFTLESNEPLHPWVPQIQTLWAESCGEVAALLVADPESLDLSLRPLRGALNWFNVEPGEAAQVMATVLSARVLLGWDRERPLLPATEIEDPVLFRIRALAANAVSWLNEAPAVSRTVFGTSNYGAFTEATWDQAHPPQPIEQRVSDMLTLIDRVRATRNSVDGSVLLRALTKAERQSCRDLDAMLRRDSEAVAALLADPNGVTKGDLRAVADVAGGRELVAYLNSAQLGVPVGGPALLPLSL